jgi:hypothetical protein
MIKNVLFFHINCAKLALSSTIKPVNSKNIANIFTGTQLAQ